MNQAQMKNGEWVFLAGKTDGFYYCTTKVCNPYGDDIHPDYKKVIITN